MHLSREENLCDNNGSQEEKEDDIEYILSLMDEITCELIEEGIKGGGCPYNYPLRNTFSRAIHTSLTT